MRTFIASIFSTIFFLPMLAEGQPLNPGQWQTYTSMRSVTDVAVSADSVHVWAATSGGAFMADLRDIQTPLVSLHTTDGLMENDLTAIATDASGNIYFGGGNGGFNIYNGSTGSLSSIPDIFSSNYPSKAINAITVSGNSVYLATGYGISIYLASEGVFGSTVTQFDTLPADDSIRQVIDDGAFVYAAAAEGVVWASESSDLQSSTNWHLVADTNGSARALVEFRGTIYVGAANGLYTLSSNRSALLPVALQRSLSIERLLVGNDSLIILDNAGNVYSTSDLVHLVQNSISSNVASMISAIAWSNGSGVIAGTALNGIAYNFNGAIQNNIFPAGPISVPTNYIYYEPTLDQVIALHGTTGIDIFHPDSASWQNLASGVGSTPNTNNNNWNSVLYDSVRNVTWFTAEKLYRVAGFGSSQPVWTRFDSTNSDLPYFTQQPSDLIITSGMMIDASGNFVVTDWASNGDGLILSSDGNTFTPYPLSSPSVEPWGPVTQDMNGNYWVGTQESDQPKSIGVYWRNMANGTYNVIAGGSGGNLGPAIEGTEFVNAMLTDQDDGIWCGTEGGVEIISNPEAILESSNPSFSIRSVSFTANQVVHTMTVDGVGNKWIGTDNGIFVVSADGSDSVAHFMAENSPLVDDKVFSIAIDPTRGEAYAATNSGISRFSTIFKQGKSDYTGIRVYPNPVVQTASASPTVTIDGLVAGSTIQIFSLVGQLINTIDGSMLGAEVQWNGRDALGRQVPSGMYLISATSPQSSENGEAKVVIVRKPSN